MNSELTCRQCRDALVELTAEMLPTADCLVVEHHLASCASCQRERDAWLALGDAIHERGQRLPSDSGFATGLMRLRAALMVHDGDDDDDDGFANLREDSPTMERDPWLADRLTDRLTLATPRDTNHPSLVGTSYRRPHQALAMTVVVVLLGALVFGTLATQLHPGSGLGAPSSATSTPSPTLTPTPAPPLAPQLVPALPGHVSVVSISMVSASDGWAVARAPNGSALLLHYANGHWTPSGDTYVDVYLTDISMDAHDDGWAVGARSDQITGVVLHYHGGHWSQVQTPSIQFAGARVWGFSPSSVVVLASLPKGKTGSLGSALLHYDNGAWTEVVSPRAISGMTLLSADDLWATCFDGHVLHYQAGEWTTYTIDGQTVGPHGQPLSISMASETDGWVGGFTGVPKGMFLARFDGRTWTRVQGPASEGPSDINSIAMLSPDQGWAGGDLDTVASGLETVLLHYVNGQWQVTSPPYRGSIGEIVMVSATEGWATVGGGDAAGLLHYQDGRWGPYRPGA